MGHGREPRDEALLLGYAFDTLGMGHVQLKTDIRNHRSQQAIHRLGATYEGVFAATSGGPTAGARHGAVQRGRRGLARVRDAWPEGRGVRRCRPDHQASPTGCRRPALPPDTLPMTWRAAAPYLGEVASIPEAASQESP